jgi:FUS-interacting serine-arginine-rich protein 1
LPPTTRFPTERERQRGRRDETPPGVSLLVRNIASNVSVSDLRAAFARIGQLKDVYIPMDYHSQTPKGFAFIEYATPEQARMAQAEMNKFLIKGKRIEVVFAQERRKTPGEMRFKGDRNTSGSRSGDRGRSNSLDRYRGREGR